VKQTTTQCSRTTKYHGGRGGVHLWHCAAWHATAPAPEPGMSQPSLPRLGRSRPLGYSSPPFLGSKVESPSLVLEHRPGSRWINAGDLPQWMRFHDGRWLVPYGLEREPNMSERYRPSLPIIYTYPWMSSAAHPASAAVCARANSQRPNQARVTSEWNAGGMANTKQHDKPASCPLGSGSLGHVNHCQPRVQRSL